MNRPLAWIMTAWNQVSGLIRELSKDKVIFVVTHDYDLSARLVPG